MIFGVGLLSLTLVRADDAPAAPADIDAANQAYSAGHYDQAATMFRQLIEAQGYSSALCFDLANAEAKQGHIGPAILNYERARYLAPHDAAIDHNLQLTRQQAGLKPNTYRWWEAMLRSIDWNLLFALIVGELALIVLAIVGSGYAAGLAETFRVTPLFVRRFCKTILFVCIPLTLLLFFVELSAIGFGNRIEGVVMAKDAPLRLSPFDSAEQTGTIAEGELVTVEQRHDDYLRVEARDKKYGWIQEKQLEPVVAGSFEPAK